MMRYLFMVCGIVFTVSYIHATTNQELFLAANKQYQDRNYTQACEQYALITHKTSAVWYNMGLCYYQLGKYAEALWALRSARRIVAQAALMDQIDRAVEQTSKAVGPTDSLSFGARLVRWVERLIVGTSVLQWQLFILILVYMLMLLVVYRQRVRWCRIICAMGAALVLGSLLVLVIKQSVIIASTAIVTVQELPVCSGPYRDCHVQGMVRYGDEVKLLTTHKNWCKVTYGSIIGWVPQESILVLTQEM